jgi:hypothetical protein
MASAMHASDRQEAAMAAIVLGFLLGLTLGAATGTAGGAFAGAMIGALFGACVHGIAWAWAHSGDAPIVERHRVICTPQGTFADVELLGDANRRRWLAVKRCSLIDGKVDCDQGCVSLMNLSHKPGTSCDCEGPTEVPQ